MQNSRKFLLFVVAGITVLCVTFSGCKKEKANAEKKEAPASTVVVSQVGKENVPIVYEYVAETQAINSVDIIPQVSGIITQASFKEGSIVKAGEKLFQIAPEPYKAALMSAQANLAQTSAALKLDVAEMARVESMVKQNTMTQQDLDKAIAQRDIDFGKCMANNSAIYQAQLNLGYCNITAPFEGQIGEIQLTVGNLAIANSSKLATLVSQTPMYASFKIPESDYIIFAENQKNSSHNKIEFKTVTANVIIGDGTVLPDAAVLDMIDNTIDRQTGTIGIRAVYPNADKMLKPNQFCRIRLTIASDKESLVIPQSAVMELQGTNSVYIVDKKNGNTVVQKTVQMGARLHDGRWVVTDGLDGTETIVSEGLLKVRPGAKVTPMSKEVSAKVIGDAVAHAEQSIAAKETSATANQETKE